MNAKYLIVAWVGVALLVGSAVSAPAWWPGRKAHVDKNKDGVVDGKERKIEVQEIRQKSRVDKPWEEKADKNNDGRVGPREAAAAQCVLYYRARADVDRPWEKAADANGDGRVDLKELRVYHVGLLDANHDGVITVAERRVYWAEKRAVVNTEVERRYDRNGDGYLSWDEGRELLKDRLVVISTHGKAIVNTDLEMEFDANGDGVIDPVEAKVVRQAIQD